MGCLLVAALPCPLGGTADNHLRAQRCQLRPERMSRELGYPDYHSLAFNLDSYDGIVAPCCLRTTYFIPMLILSYLSADDIRVTFWYDRGIVLFLEKCLGSEASVIRF